VNGFLSFTPLACTHVPPDVTTPKLRENSIFENHLALCLQNLWFYVEVAISNFWLCCGRFYPKEILLDFFKILNWPANENKTLSLTDQSLEGMCWRCRPGD